MWIDSKTDQSLIVLPINTDGLTEEQAETISAIPRLTENEKVEINRSFTPYIFYNRVKSGSYTCFCTYCNTEFSSRYKKVHGSFDRCPHCGTDAMLKGAWFSQKNLTEWLGATIFRACGDKLAAVNVVVSKAYNGNPWSLWSNRLYPNDSFIRCPDLEVDIKSIYIWGEGSAVRYLPFYSYNKDGAPVYRLRISIESIKPGTTGMSQGAGFMRREMKHIYIGRDIPDKSPLLRYAALELADRYDPCAYISAYVQYPILEYAIKSKAYILINDLITRARKNYKLCNWRAKTPKAFFRGKLNGKEIREMIDGRYEPEVMLIYISSRDSGQKITIPEAKSMNWTAQINFKGWKNPLDYTSYKKIKKYLNRFDFNSEHSGFSYYADYLRCAKAAGFDLTQKNVLFPRDLTHAHNNAVEVMNMIAMQKEAARVENEAREYEKRYKKLCSRFSKFHFDGILISVPQNAYDIIREGKLLQHCVGTYASDHMKGKTSILFIRKPEDPETPWFTVEVYKGRLKQCHGYKNEIENGIRKPKPEIIISFEKAFEEWLKASAEKKTQPKAS